MIKQLLTIEAFDMMLGLGQYCCSQVDITSCPRERSGSVVKCLTQDRRAVGSSLTGVTALCP